MLNQPQGDHWEFTRVRPCSALVIAFPRRSFILGPQTKEQRHMNRTLSALWGPLLATVFLFIPGCGNNEPANSPTENPAMLIQPGVSVGKVGAGMRMEEVRRQLGEPQRSTPNALEYTSLGFAVMPGGDGVVQVVMCGDVTGNSGPLVKRFTGRTKEGIGLGSSREDLIKAYGEPSKDENFPGARESMKYDQLGITFSLEAAKVHHMIIRLKKPAAAEHTIEVTPTEPGSK
jgi:hypothetical protein